MTRPDFSLNPIAALVVAHNTVAEHISGVRPVTKFSDKATAVKRVNAAIDAVESAGFVVSYLPNGAIERIDQLDAQAIQARSNAAIAEAVASNLELAAMVTVGQAKTVDVMQTESGPQEYVSYSDVHTIEPAAVGGLTTLELTHRIEVLVENPKRKGSRAHAVFSLYRTGMTGEEFVRAVIAAGHDRRVALSNLHWDLDHGFIHLGE